MVYPAYSYNGIIAPHSHNLFLQIVSDAGVAALGVFLLLLFVFFRMMCAALHREKDCRTASSPSAWRGCPSRCTPGRRWRRRTGCRCW